MKFLLVECVVEIVVLVLFLILSLTRLSRLHRVRSLVVAGEIVVSVYIIVFMFPCCCRRDSTVYLRGGEPPARQGNRRFQGIYEPFSQQL